MARRKNNVNNVVIDRINNFKNNKKNFTSEKIMDTYIKINGKLRECDFNSNWFKVKK